MSCCYCAAGSRRPCFGTGFLQLVTGMCTAMQAVAVHSHTFMKRTHRTQAVAARLEALENDNNDVQDPFGLVDDDDDEFVIASDGEEGGCPPDLACCFSPHPPAATG